MEFKVSDPRGPSCTKVLFNIYDDVIALYRDVIASPTSDHLLICSAINMRRSGQRIPCNETVPTNFSSTYCASVISTGEG